MNTLISRLTGRDTTQVQIPFLVTGDVWKANLLRSGIINAVGNIRTTEVLSSKAFQGNKQIANQAKNRETLHRAQIQRLAALANEHARLCYDFKHAELILSNLDWQIDPTCRRALINCLIEILALQLTSTALISPFGAHPAVITIIDKWYTPAFTCTKPEFHGWLWKKTQQDDRTISSSRELPNGT